MNNRLNNLIAVSDTAIYETKSKAYGQAKVEWLTSQAEQAMTMAMLNTSGYSQTDIIALALQSLKIQAYNLARPKPKAQSVATMQAIVSQLTSDEIKGYLARGILTQAQADNLLVGKTIPTVEVIPQKTKK